MRSQSSRRQRLLYQLCQRWMLANVPEHYIPLVMEALNKYPMLKRGRKPRRTT